MKEKREQNSAIHSLWEEQKVSIFRWQFQDSEESWKPFGSFIVVIIVGKPMDLLTFVRWIKKWMRINPLWSNATEYVITSEMEYCLYIYIVSDLDWIGLDWTQFSWAGPGSVAFLIERAFVDWIITFEFVLIINFETYNNQSWIF